MRICVFVSEEFHNQIKEIGDVVIGNDAVLKEIGEGKAEYDKIIATQDLMN